MRSDHSRHVRRGSVLVEFALIALVLYFLLAATVEFGRIMYSAQTVQQAADVAARELAKTPLPPTLTFDQFLFPQAGEDASVAPARARVYDRKYLVLPLDDADTPPLPLLNQQLKLLMIVDELPDGTRVRRYPGQLVPLPDNQFGFTVVVPLVVSQADGTETVDPVPREVVEEVTAANGVGPFSLVAALPPDQEWMRGTVALRINYPYQAATMASFPVDATDPYAPNLVNPNPVLDDDGTIGPNAGSLGLGRLEVAGKQARPFRKVLTGQAFARREVFGP